MGGGIQRQAIKDAGIEIGLNLIASAEDTRASPVMRVEWPGRQTMPVNVHVALCGHVPNIMTIQVRPPWQLDWGISSCGRSYYGRVLVESDKHMVLGMVMSILTEIRGGRMVICILGHLRYRVEVDGGSLSARAFR